MFGQGVFDSNEVLQRFGHLAPGDGQVTSVQEIPYPVIVLKVSLSKIYNVKALIHTHCFSSDLLFTRNH